MDISLAKIVSIGIYNSQIAQKNKTVTQNRTATMFEIELPTEVGGIAYIDSDRMPILPTTVICAKPGQVRHSKLPLKCCYIHMILDEGALYDTLLALPTFICGVDHKKYRVLFERLCRYYDTALEQDELMVHGLILELVHMLISDSHKLQHRGTAGGRRNSSETMEKVIRYIKENLTADLSLENVARYAGFSPIHFHNAFKVATAKTLHDYVEEQRIKKAAQLIVSTDHTLTKIAYECGFSSQSYFSYVFKRRMKLTPREYAKQVFSRYDAEV